MSPISIIAGILMLAVATRPAVSQPPPACTTGIEKCTESLMSSLQSGSMGEGGPCGILQGYTDCIMNMGCPLSQQQVNEILQSATAPLASQGIQCPNIKTDGSSGSGTGTGSDTGAGTDMGGMDGGMGGGMGGDSGMGGVSKECSDAMAKCTKDYTSSMTGEMDGGVCGVLKTYSECVSTMPCPFDEGTKAQMVGTMYSQMDKQGIKCDSDTGTMVTGGPSGGGSTGPLAMFFQLKEAFQKHKCGAISQGCVDKEGGDSTEGPNCEQMKKSVQCMFSECSAIRGTKEETAAIDAVIKYGKGTLKCSFTATELKGNGSPGAVTGSLLVLMLSAVVTMFFV